MTKTQLAAPEIFQGTPRITAPSVYGASPRKPLLYKVPVLGERPIAFSAQSLPKGLTMDSQTGIISGIVEMAGQYKVTLRAENARGTDIKELLLDIAPDNIARTPLMGWTSWNVYRNAISQEKILGVAKALRESGLSEFGYQYVNIDSGWQDEYGGEFDAILPKPTFPDMKKLCKDVHELGLKIGIYSTPMQLAWGGGFLPGCTQAPLDPHFADTYFGIGQVHKEKNNVNQWCDWEFDYLKYDWAPSDIHNAGIMRQCLSESGRDFAFSVTVRADIRYKDFWMKNCSSWRDNCDSDDRWEKVMEIFHEADKWTGICCPGHFFDIDMLETGRILCRENNLTQDEQLAAFSYRVIFPSPLQISCDITHLSDFDLAMYGNEEMIAVNQDALGIGAHAIVDDQSFDEHQAVVKHIKVFKKPLEDGGYALGCFNFGTTTESITLPLGKVTTLRDLWAKQDVSVLSGNLSVTLEPHTVRMFKVQ